MYGVLIMLLSGILGYVLQKCSFPTAPVLLAFVLAPLLESNVRKSFIISRGSLGIFFEKPISLVLIIVLFGILLFPIVRYVLTKAGFIKTAK